MTGGLARPDPPVIVGTDGSACSAAAIQWAAAEAERRQRPLWIVRVFEPVHAVASALDAITPVEAQRIAAEIDLSEAVGSVDVDTTVRRVWVHGDPVQELSALALGAELLVVGSRGLGGLAGVLLGSTSLRLAMHAPCPVAVVRHAQHDGQGAGPARVVAAVDGGPDTDLVIDSAFHECEIRGAGLTAVHAYSPPSLAFSDHPGARAWPELHECEVALLADRLAAWRAKHPDVDVVAKTVHGHLAPALIAESSGAALVVMAGSMTPSWARRVETCCTTPGARC